MAKYTLTVASDDLNDVIQCLTPALVTAVKGVEVLSVKAEEVPAVAEEKVEPEAKPAAKPAAKRGRRPRAEVQPEPETVETPVPTEKAVDEDFSDALADEPVAKEEVVTKQAVTDAAIEVGSKHGRDIMIAAITKFTETGKLAGVAESDYPKLKVLLDKLSASADKAAAKIYLDTI